CRSWNGGHFTGGGQYEMVSFLACAPEKQAILADAWRFVVACLAQFLLLGSPSIERAQAVLVWSRAALATERNARALGAAPAFAHWSWSFAFGLESSAAFIVVCAASGLFCLSHFGDESSAAGNPIAKDMSNGAFGCVAVGERS